MNAEHYGRAGANPRVRVYGNEIYCYVTNFKKTTILSYQKHMSRHFRIIHRKISDNDVIVHGESARKEYADTVVYTVQ